MTRKHANTAVFTTDTKTPALWYC